MTRSAHLALASALLALGSATTQAAYIGSLEFVQPTGFVGPTDSIEVRMRWTLAEDSDALLMNPSGANDPPFGIPPGNLPTTAQTEDGFGNRTFHQNVTWTSITNVFLNTFFVCDATFGTGCSSGPPYDFNFNTSGPEAINFRNDVELLPGESLEYVFGTFVPYDGASVPEGEYFLYGTGITLNVRGDAQVTDFVYDEFGDPVPVLDEDGDPVYDEFGDPVYEMQTVDIFDAQGDLTIAGTPCRASDGPSCVGTFSRTVVPLPATAWLFATGFGLIGAWRRVRAAR